jgi:aspartyl-tRNA(Asn)/glutamyl-tRNA(Gln) amidotransferase subunit B
MNWEIVIGIETHAQLSTVSKMFSGGSTAFGAPPNTQANAVDIALPGVLPVANKAAVERAIRFGLAVGGEKVINRRSVFARKNYFYPDLPKGYQISQYEFPIVKGGEIRILTKSGEETIRLTRAHLEEDAGKSIHGDALSGIVGMGVVGQMVVGGNYSDVSGIDLNRAGVPLLEIVSEPDMRSAEEAVAYAKALHALVRWIGICDGNMQEGSFRCDANVSVRQPGASLGTRAEIKNLNSFRFLQEAIEYEVRRQIAVLEDGGKVAQETRLYDPEKHETRSMRIKEDAHDYRYFPDPDLLPLEVSEEWIGTIKASMWPLQEQVKARFLAKSYEEYAAWEDKIDMWVDEAANQVIYGLPEQDARELSSDLERARYFQKTVELVGVEHAKLCANWILGDLAAALNRAGKEISQSPVSPEQMASLIRRIVDGTLTGKMAKEVFDAMWVPFVQHDRPNPARRQIQQADIPPNLLASTLRPDTVDEIIEKRGLKQISDSGEIEKIVDQVIAANAKQVEDYRAGKEKAFNSLVGQVMKATQGKANPAQVNEILKRKLAG